MVHFKNFVLEFDSSTGKQSMSFDGILLATKESFDLSENDAQQLEFFDLSIYQTCDHKLVIHGFSPFCNEQFLEVIDSNSTLDLSPLIERIVGCMSIGDDQVIVDGFMQKVKSFAESIFISEIVNVDSIFDTSAGITAKINEFEKMAYCASSNDKVWSHRGKAIIETISHKIQLNLEWRVVRNTYELEVIDFDFFGLILNNKENINQIFAKLNSPQIINLIYKKIKALVPSFEINQPKIA